MREIMEDQNLIIQRLDTQEEVELGFKIFFKKLEYRKL